ncbi:hypothetical protein SNE40_000999 [Patella caerulea]|uniref:Cysteine protease n=1 Tax=Patella caerulea TaxID=87958 RepID=A0AAN8KHR2_PATCE
MEYEGSLTYENGPLYYEDFPRTDDPLYILGEKYSTLYDRDELKHDVLSRIWFTYRRNFAAIGGNGPINDTGWGCMLRCGQMMLAQALILRHLGRKWRWNPQVYDQIYWKVLSMFQDKKSSYYSIHQIASMGDSEGKAVGQWFGPNTIAQVLKKISVYDEWSNIVVHVAMDNTVIESDIRKLCRLCDTDKSNSSDINGGAHHKTDSEGFTNCTFNTGQKNQSETRQRFMKSERWKPLLLIIPLRLGLTDINPVYFDSLKSCLGLRQSVGIIGGKPNHAHWFIGYLGEELVYLDPHTTQLFVNLDDKSSTDDSYHCPFPGRMRLNQLDPSVAVGFYCGTEEDFDDLCLTFHKFIIRPCKNPMFELYKERPAHLPSCDSDIETHLACNSSDFTVLKGVQGADGGAGSTDSDEEFEIL